MHEHRSEWKINWLDCFQNYDIPFVYYLAGFVITNPSGRWLRLTAHIGLTVNWDVTYTVRVAVSGKYRTKMCGLCGNFNGNPSDDSFKPDPECVSPNKTSVCSINDATKNKPYMDKCKYMNEKGSPFVACNAVVDPSQLIKDCQYDACECDDPMKCVCKSFAAYSQQCSDKGVVLKWRFAATFLFPALKQCGRNIVDYFEYL